MKIAITYKKEKQRKWYNTDLQKFISVTGIYILIGYF